MPDRTIEELRSALAEIQLRLAELERGREKTPREVEYPDDGPYYAFGRRPYLPFVEPRPVVAGDAAGQVRRWQVTGCDDPGGAHAASTPDENTYFAVSQGAPAQGNEMKWLKYDTTPETPVDPPKGLVVLDSENVAVDVDTASRTVEWRDEGLHAGELAVYGVEDLDTVGAADEATGKAFYLEIDANRTKQAVWRAPATIEGDRRAPNPPGAGPGTVDRVASLANASGGDGTVECYLDWSKAADVVTSGAVDFKTPVSQTKITLTGKLIGIPPGVYPPGTEPPDDGYVLPPGTPPAVLCLQPGGIIEWVTISTLYQGVYRNASNAIEGGWLRAHA